MKFSGYSFYGNGDINFCINSYMNTLQRDFQNQVYRLTILKFRARLAEKHEEEEEKEHSQTINK